MLKKITGGDGGDDEGDKEKKASEGESPPPALLVIDADMTEDDSAAPKLADEKEKEGVTPFLASQDEKSADTEAPPVAESIAEEEPAPVAPIVEKKVEAVVEPLKEEAKQPTMSKVEKLRAQAARIRLEADKQQVELTLEKIDKLNDKLEKLKKKDVVDQKDKASLEEELQMLKSKLMTDEMGEIKPVAAPVVARKVEPVAASETTGDFPAQAETPRPTLSAQVMEERVQQFQQAPEFMKILVAKTMGFGVNEGTPGSVDRLNATDIVQKMFDDGVDYDNIADSASGFEFTDESDIGKILEKAGFEADTGNTMPVFTEEQIQTKLEELEDVPQFIKDIANSTFKFVDNDALNETGLALAILEDEWEQEQRKKEQKGFFGLFGGDEAKGDAGKDGDRGSFSKLFSERREEVEKSELSFMMESLYPNSSRKEGEAPDKKLVDTFLNDIVATTKAFSPSEKAVAVPGGWIIRGKNECKSGGELIEKLDKRMANDARLRDNISVFLLKEPFPDPDSQTFDPFDWPQCLFVAGPSVARDPQVLLRTGISSLGIATVWYGSIYPFLANSKLLDRATESMDLADAGMPTDLSWLSEMSIPLFLTFMALQAVHEIAHVAVAKSKNFEISIPTLVPSILSGLTGSITALKSSPKNRQDLVDFALAGPMTGMIASIAVLCYRLALTASADAATVASYPGLPLAILRQSSLGGGLIDIFLGDGVLNVPASAEAAQALASTLIALHPLAVAGFFSLFVNALALVPAGRTDGGRISMALLGRSGTQGVTFVSLATLFLLGFTNESDLLLFYFSFLAFCQSELEIPLRNEIDDVDFSRVLISGFAGFLMILTLVPMS